MPVTRTQKIYPRSAYKILRRLVKEGAKHLQAHVQYALEECLPAQRQLADALNGTRTQHERTGHVRHTRVRSSSSDTH